MHAIKRKNPLTESFLVQLDVDLESAGLEDTKSLRAKIVTKPQQATKSTGCANMGLPTNGGPQQAQMNGRPTFGDQGLGVYNRPQNTDVPTVPVGSNNASTYNINTSQENGFVDMLPNVNKFELPNREQRTPGSYNSMPESQHSNLNADMDTSPDGSGGDQHTPNSQQHQSSHTSNTAYSPLNMQDFTNNANNMPNPAFFEIDANDPSGFISTDFEMHSFPSNPFDNQQQGFVLPQRNWDDGGGGGGTGFTPGASGMGDMVGMSDADWSQVLEGLGDWDPAKTIGHEGNMFDTMATATRR